MEQKSITKQQSVIIEQDNEDLPLNKQLNNLMENLKQQKQLMRNKSMENYNNLKKLRINEQKQRLNYYNPSNYIKKPAFIPKPAQKKFFEKHSDVFLGASGRVGAYQRVSSIFPDKVQNPSTFIAGLGPTNKGVFGTVPKQKLTEKEIQRIEYWDKSVQERSQNLYEQMIKRQDGRVKKMQLQKQVSNIFKPNSFHHDVFGPSDSFISDVPRTPVEVSRLITLERNYEKYEKWIPNKLIPQLFENNIYRAKDPYLLRYQQ